MSTFKFVLAHRSRLRLGESFDSDPDGRADAQVTERITHQANEIARADLEQQRPALAAGDADAKAIFILRFEAAHDHAHAAIHEAQRRHLFAQAQPSPVADRANRKFRSA